MQLSLMNTLLVGSAVYCAGKAGVETAKAFGQKESVNKLTQNFKDLFPCSLAGDREIKMCRPLTKIFGEGPFVVKERQLNAASSVAKTALYATMAFGFYTAIQ